jgi:hypothetical protein
VGKAIYQASHRISIVIPERPQGAFRAPGMTMERAEA